MDRSASSLERAAARNLVTRYLRVRPGENVIVEAWAHTLPMSSAIVDEVRRAGGSAFLAYEDDDAWWRAMGRNQARLLGRLSDPEWAALRAAQVYVQFWGPGDSDRLAKFSEKRFDVWATGWFDRWYRIARSTGLRGGRMATGWVTEGRARHWNVDRERWRTSLLRGCLADPAAMAAGGRRLQRALRGRKRVRITHRNGTDLEVALAGVPARLFDGVPHPKNPAYGQYDMMSNFPDGRVRVALDASTAEGTIVASRRSYDQVWFPWATYTGGTFEFSDGRLSSFSFAEGGTDFGRNYRRATAGKDRTGSLSIGLNPRLRDVPYLEDRERGCLQLAVGANAYLGGKNRSNFFGAICLAGAEIAVDGVPVVRAGTIL